MADEPFELLLHRASAVAAHLARDPGRHELQHAAILGDHRREQGADLLLGGEGAGYRLAVHVAVARGTTGAQPQRAGAQRVARR